MRRYFLVGLVVWGLMASSAAAHSGTLTDCNNTDPPDQSPGPPAIHSSDQAGTWTFEVEEITPEGARPRARFH
jgi:hypothetical protein